MAADDHDFRHGCALESTYLSQRLKSVAVRQPDVQQHDVIVDIAQQLKRLCCSCAGCDEIAFFAQNSLERFANLTFVIDDQDVVQLSLLHCRARSSQISPALPHH